MFCRILTAACLLTIAFALHRAEAAEPKQILLLHSFGRDFAPWNEYARDIRAELDRQVDGPVDIYEASLATARFADETVEEPFAEYLRSLFAGRRLDLVVVIGAPAASFFQRYRQRLFPGTPMLFTAVEQRRVPFATLTPMDTAVAIDIDFAAVIEHILQVLPETTNIVVVMGNSPIEKYWNEQLREAVQPYLGRVGFTWFNELSFEEMLKRAAVLPPRTAIFFGLLSVDAAGVAHEEGKAVDRLHAVANAPMFTYVDAYFGRGIVGGPLISVLEVSRKAASVAVRLLHGEEPSGIRPAPTGFAAPRFDWRELRRWGIGEKMLPVGSVVEFQSPTVFEQYGWYIAGGIALVVIEAMFIVALLFNRRRLERERSERQRAEETARDFSGRLISAQEDERSRLARELHDDVTQRLALLAIDAGRGARASGDGESGTMSTMRDNLIRLSEDVHALSYRLHPSILDDLGLNEALKSECQRFSHLESIPVALKLPNGSDAPPQQLALCLFRIAQEALRNVGRHAQAKTVEISLRREDDGYELCIRDDGIGFDPKRHRDRPSLGLASMRQRIYLLGGEFEAESAPGQGTMVLAWLPLKEERRESSARAVG